MSFTTTEIIDEAIITKSTIVDWKPAELDSEIIKNRIRKYHYFEETSDFKFTINGTVYQLTLPENSRLEITDYSQFELDKIRFRLFIGDSEEPESFSIEEGLIHASEEFLQKYFETFNPKSFE